MNSSSKVRLDLFDPSLGLARGKPRWFEALWYLVKCGFFLTAIPWPSSLKVVLLRWFGGAIGEGIVIKPRVNIHFPWKLTIGDHVWLGEEVFILNLEPVTIGDHCCISQRAFLCTGNHDYHDPAFRYRSAPIVIEDGTWVGASCFVGPGVTVGKDAVLTAGSVATRNVPEGMVCSGFECLPIRTRWV